MGLIPCRIRERVGLLPLSPFKKYLWFSFEDLCLYQKQRDLWWRSTSRLLKLAPAKKYLNQRAQSQNLSLSIPESNFLSRWALTHVLLQHASCNLWWLLNKVAVFHQCFFLKKKLASVSGAMAHLSKWTEMWWCSSRRSRSRMRACTPARRPFIIMLQRSLSRWTSWARTGCLVRTLRFVFSTYVTFMQQNRIDINILHVQNFCSPAELRRFSHQSVLHFSAGVAGGHLFGLSHCDHRHHHFVGMLVSRMD